MERTAEISSADTLSIGKKNQELEEAIETLRLEILIAVNRARVTARWELMREWLQKKNNQWDQAKALEQYQTVALSVPGTELGVPFSGDLERSLIGDPRVWVLPGGWRK
ncbi:hypothetical protein F2Q68_00017406 [Brassica cretica]|uniref:Uncharacterized protein n=1 Tax=Brassica cretica TaxID=69181 RepID=A0A8S9H7M7_BRACR|nr:hypothetical protein F2Q68_00017406 [Brassica cretica]